MGAYLSEPITDKEFGSGSGNGLRFGFASMQGWRRSQEDAHLAVVDLGGECAGLSFFAVFDGHGGREVAHFCEEHVPELFQRHVAAALSKRAGSSSSSTSPPPPLADDPALWGRALVRTFHSLDDMLRQPEHGTRLLELKEKPGDRRDGGQENSAVSSAARLAQARLQSAVSSGIDESRQAGGRISADQARRMVVQMSMLKRLEHMSATESSEPKNPATAAFAVGCTAVCVVMSSRHIVCANAGDSRAVLCRQGKAVPLSFDHKPTDEVERRRIINAGGYIKETCVGEGHHRRMVYRVNGNLNLSRSLGDLAYKTRDDLGPELQVISATPDLVVQERTPEDEFLVLGCDGIWEVKENPEACAFVRPRLAAGKDLQGIAAEMLDECLTADPQKSCGRGADNMTLVVVQLRDAISSRPARRAGCWQSCFGAQAD